MQTILRLGVEIGGYFDGQIIQEKTAYIVPRVLNPKITSLHALFSNSDRTNIQGIEYWDTSNIKDMAYMFAFTIAFNQDLSNWKVSNVSNYENFAALNTVWFEQYKPKFKYNF